MLRFRQAFWNQELECFRIGFRRFLLSNKESTTSVAMSANVRQGFSSIFGGADEFRSCQVTKCQRANWRSRPKILIFVADDYFLSTSTEKSFFLTSTKNDDFVVTCAI